MTQPAETSMRGQEYGTRHNLKNPAVPHGLSLATRAKLQTLNEWEKLSRAQ